MSTNEEMDIDASVLIGKKRDRNEERSSVQTIFEGIRFLWGVHLHSIPPAQRSGLTPSSAHLQVLGV